MWNYKAVESSPPKKEIKYTGSFCKDIHFRNCGNLAATETDETVVIWLPHKLMTKDEKVPNAITTLFLQE